MGKSARESQYCCRSCFVCGNGHSINAPDLHRDNVVKHKKQKHSIISQPRRGVEARRHSFTRDPRERFSWHSGFPGLIPEGFNWQDPKFMQPQEHIKPPKPKQPKEPDSESESESVSENETPIGDRKINEGADMMNLAADFGRKIFVAEDVSRCLIYDQSELCTNILQCRFL